MFNDIDMLLLDDKIRGKIYDPRQFPEYFTPTFHIFSLTSNGNYNTTNVVEKPLNRRILTLKNVITMNICIIIGCIAIDLAMRLQ